MKAVLAFAVLIALQVAIAWLLVRSAAVRRLVKAEPASLPRRPAFALARTVAIGRLRLVVEKDLPRREGDVDAVGHERVA